MAFNVNYRFVGRKVVIHLKNQICVDSDELLSSNLFEEILRRFMAHLKKHESPYLSIFAKPAREVDEGDFDTILQVLVFLSKMSVELIPKVVPNSERCVRDPIRLNDFVEQLYNFWRSFERYLICDSTGERFDKRPYRTFNATIESLMHLVRGVYRDIQENITGKHPSIYRQIRAGAEVAAIARPKSVILPDGPYAKLKDIPLIRQMLLYPPLLLNPPMNKRSGRFEKIALNPLERVEIQPEEWLGYPAKVGPLLVLVYFHQKFFELGFSLANLFELADDEFLQRPVDAVYLFGTPEGQIDDLAAMPTVFFDDEEHHLLSAAVPARDEFGYFGYLKKMILTLHNVQMMKRGKLPFHGAAVNIVLKGDRSYTLLIIGDTGTGKSETLEAFRAIGDEELEEMVIIADDMGSLDLREDGRPIAYGSEIGAFVRLDDLRPGYAFGQLDRAIIMSPSKINARIVLPVSSYEQVVRGYPIDLVLYANNYEEIDEEHPLIERVEGPEAAFRVFREGTAMSKGTTTSTGLTHSYFANIFGPVQYKSLHDEIAKQYFEAFDRSGIFVGQLRTRLGIPGWERSGPEEAARELLRFLMK